VPGPVRGDHHGHAQPGVARRGGHGVEDEVGEDGDPPEAGGVPARVDLDLQPPAAVGDVVLRGLPHQAADVVLGAQHGAGHVVEPLEAEPALLVGRRQLRRPLRDERVGQVDAVARGQLEQRLVPHRPREVKMQVRFREGREFAVVAGQANPLGLRFAVTSPPLSGSPSRREFLLRFAPPQLPSARLL
jgi:hypothetical protein